MFYIGQTHSKKTSIIFIFEGDSAFFVQVVKCLKKKKEKVAGVMI